MVKTDLYRGSFVMQMYFTVVNDDAGTKEKIHFLSDLMKGIFIENDQMWNLRVGQTLSPVSRQIYVESSSHFAIFGSRIRICV